MTHPANRFDPSRYDVRPLGDDEDDYISIVGESLLNYGTPIWKRYLDKIGRENTRTIHHNGRCIGGLAFYRMGHWFGGRSIATAGISGVAISPAERGNGTCRLLLETVLRENYDDGFPLASLYASTQALYRKIGFEQAGTQTLYSLPMSSITSGHSRACPVQRVESPSFEVLETVAQQRAAAGNGQLQRTEGMWQRLVSPNDGSETKTYLFGDPAQPQGYAILKANQPKFGVPQSLVATDVAVNSHAAAERLLSLIRDHRSIFDSFRWYGAPNDPLLLFADEGRATVVAQTRWMERILNVPAALSQRGYPAGITATIDLQIDDELIPENSGNWQIRIADGGAQVQAGGEGSLRISVRALAPLFSAYCSATELVQLGQIQASCGDQIAAADRVFAGPAAWMPEVF
jgi:predicted acetyltransferase